MARHGRGIMLAEKEKENKIPESKPLKPWQKAVAARKANIEARKRLEQDEK